MIDFLAPPFFEDLAVGDDFSEVPAVTITSGMAALHQAVFGDRSRLYLDQALAEQVTGREGLPVNPMLVCNLAIGQSTFASQRVLGNLFYRGLRMQAPVFVGDTLVTETRVVALRQNRAKPGRAASGMVGLEILARNQRGETALHFWRCPMIPCRDKDAQTGHEDSLDAMPEALPDELLIESLPRWELAPFAERVARRSYALGEALTVPARDTVTSAPEVARLTLNMAMAHTDGSRSAHGRRLVYGGHTIGVAAAQLARAMPDLVSIIAWYKCDHLAPVFEEDILESRVTPLAMQDLAQGRLAKLQVKVAALRDGESTEVLDWELAAWLV